MTRVAYVCADPGVPVFGHKGCSVHVQEVVRALSAHGAAVELFAVRRGGDRPPGLGGVRVHDLDAPAGEGLARERAALAANGGLRSALETAGPFDFVYERYSLWSFAGMEYARDRRVPGLLEVNAPLVEEQRAYRELCDVAAAEVVATRVFGAATRLLAVSDETAAYLESRAEARGRVDVVANGVDAERFHPRLRAGRPETDRFTVGFVGSLKPWHGLPLLVDAFAGLCRRVPAARLLVVGDGPERDRLLTELAGAGVEDRARLTGAVDPSDVPGLVASMDAAVAPYPAGAPGYFSPLKVYEYMAAGVPVVASRIPPLARLLDDGVTGLLVEPGDVGQLGQALERLAGDGALRARLAAAARAEVLRDGTWAAVGRRLLAVAGAESDAALPARRRT